MPKNIIAKWTYKNGFSGCWSAVFENSISEEIIKKYFRKIAYKEAELFNSKVVGDINLSFQKNHK